MGETEPKPAGKVVPETVDESRLREMVLHLPFFAVMIDRERHFVWVNRLDSTLTLDQVIGVKVDTYVHPSCLQTCQETIEAAFATGEHGYYEARAYGEGDVATWYGIRVVPLPPNAAGDERALLLSSDVTERHRAEQALRESEARFRMLTEASPDFVAIVDAEQRINYINRKPTDEAQFEVVGRTIAELTQPEYAETARQKVAHTLKTGEPTQYEGKGILDDRWFVTRVIRLPSNESGPTALVTSTDVTPQRKAEAERAQLEAQLQQAQKLETMGELAGGLAHDFNNLLMVIQNHLEFMRSALPKEHPATEDLARVQLAADRAQDLTRGLLAIGRRQPHAPRVLNLSDFVEPTMKLLRRVLPESIVLDLDVAESPLLVHADAGQIEQVLLNLCINARDAIEGSGRIVVRVRRADEGETEGRGRAVALSVSDTGVGMDEATQARAFEPFFTTKPPDRGTGLGLAMVHGIITQNRGRVRLDSTSGRGTTITAVLPEVNERGEERGKPALKPAHAGGTETILVAEDEAAVRGIVTRLLEGAGYRVIEAENGERAVELYEELGKDIDLVLLDAVMPVLDGRGAYERMLELDPQVRVLFSSGYAGDALPHAFLEQHDLTLLPKPYRSGTLLRAVRGVLGALE